MNGAPKRTKPESPKSISYTVGVMVIGLINLAGAMLITKVWNALVIWNPVSLFEGWLMFFAVAALILAIVYWRRR